MSHINEDMIREAAYFLWEKAGRPEGSAEFFWMKACEQFFAPKKVAIKKPCAKKACAKKPVAAKPAPKKGTQPAKASTPALVKKPCACAKKTCKKTK